jgi:2-aminobenzoylacetyl-CoA thioesterase
MWIAEPGKVHDSIDFLGTREICLYLVKGQEAMIVGGGMTHLAPILEGQLSRTGVDCQKIKYLVIPHSHFDHCGAVPYLKRRFPRLEILASAYAAEVFSKPKVIDFISAANKATADAMGFGEEYEGLGLEFDGIHVDRVVGDGDVVDLGDGISVRFIEAPGHTKCSLATYVPSLKAMFPSDAAPCLLPGGKGTVMPSPQYDFRLYLASLQKISAYDVHICAFEHFGVLVGEQATNTLREGLERTERLAKHVMKQYKETGDVEKVAQRIASEIRERNELPFLSSELQAEVARTVIRKILAV